MRISFVLLSFLACFSICGQNNPRSDFEELKSTFSKEKLEEIEKKASDPNFQKKMKKGVDSLMNEMKEVEEILNSPQLSLREKVDSSLKVIKRGYQRNPWNAEKDANSVYLFSRKHKMLDAQARSAELLGLTQDILGKKESDTSYQLALQLYSDLENKDKQIECLTHLIRNANNRSDEKEFQRYKNSVHKILYGNGAVTAEINESAFRNFYENMGEIYMQRGALDSAIEYHEKALRISEELESESRNAGSYLNLGNVYYQKGDYVRAFDYWLKCKEIAKRTEDLRLQSMVSISMGSAYSALRQKALFCNSF